jgi:uncharacterized protein (DUF488 family)
MSGPGRMSRELFTVGYEGKTVEGFIADLLSKNIRCVLDVRRVPFSRKPGFSRGKLARRLRLARIDYVHLPDLGTPKALREQLNSSGDYSVFFERMNRYLGDKTDAIEEACRYVMNSRCCLMCFEQFAAQCHRKVVAEQIKVRGGNGLQIKHI